MDEERKSSGFEFSYKRISTVIMSVALTFFVLAGIILTHRFFDSGRSMETHMNLYFEEMRHSGKLVLLEASQRFELSKDYSTRLLALIDIRSSIRLAVMAKISYYIDLSDPHSVGFAWNRRSGELYLRLPHPKVLQPAIDTATLDVSTKGVSLISSAVFRLREEAENMKSGLSGELQSQAEASLLDPRLLESLRTSVSSLATSWLFARTGAKVSKISVLFE